MIELEPFFPLDATGRAAVLGITFAELTELQRSDPRILRALPSRGALHRLKRWLRAGEPIARTDRLRIHAPRDVQEIVLRVVATLPLPIRWHVVEHTAIRETGRCERGRASGALEARRPDDGDQAHEINLCGRESLERIGPLFAHEVGHCWTMPIVIPDENRQTTAMIALGELSNDPDLPPEERPRLTQALELLVAEWAHRDAIGEKIADRLASLFGWHFNQGSFHDIKARLLREYRAAVNLTNPDTETQDEIMNTEHANSEEQHDDVRGTPIDQPSPINDDAVSRNTTAIDPLKYLVCDMSVADENGNFPPFAE